MVQTGEAVVPRIVRFVHQNLTVQVVKKDLCILKEPVLLELALNLIAKLVVMMDVIVVNQDIQFLTKFVKRVHALLFGQTARFVIPMDALNVKRDILDFILLQLVQSALI